MNVQWSHILIPVGVGVATGLTTDATMWTDLRQALLSVVAIISAGVLVRLARGVPFTAIDVLEADEARTLSGAIKQSVRALGVLLAVCFLTTLSLIFIGQLSRVFGSEAAQRNLPFTESFDYVALIVSFLLTFVFMRTYAVVKGDIQIVDIQANILFKKRNGEAADNFQDDVATPAKKGFQAPSGYGRVIEDDKA